MRKIMLSAGEVSGDLHASHLVREIKKLAPDTRFFGMGSEKMRKAGVDVRLDISEHNTIGLVEIFPHAFYLLSALARMKKFLRDEHPDLLITVDSQGFNIPLAKEAKKMGIRTVYYIPPQEWLWGTEKGLRAVAECIDLVVAIWEKEYEAYRSIGANTVYFGHPLLDIVKPSMGKAEFCKKFGLKEKHPLVALCPGSRRQEIKGLLPVFLKAGELIRRKFPKTQYIMPVSSSNLNLPGLIGASKVTAIEGQIYDVLAHSDLAIAASGTINLEACMLGTPNIMAYKLHPLTYFIGKYILKIGMKMKYFSMPNLLCDDLIIPELIQKDANPPKIAAIALGLLSTAELQKPALFRVKEHLGRSPVISRIATAILNEAKML